MNEPAPTHVKEAAEDICINLLFAPSPASHKQAVIDTIAILLKHLPQPSEWVDVNERLPEYDVEVLIGFLDTDRPFPRFIWCRGYLRGSTGKPVWDYFDALWKVTHWHPMLQPPEQKEKV